MRKLLLLLALPVVVDAGSRIWQPPITRYDSLENQQQSQDARNSIRNLPETQPLTASSLNQRWLLIRRPYQQRSMWPNRCIRYCFQTEQDETLYKSYVDDAIMRWHTSGFDEGTYSFQDIDRSECLGDQRSTSLVITTGSDFSSSIGRVPANTALGVDGPRLDIPRDLGGVPYSQIVTHMAHELGHSWGLLHEHQNPYLWRQEQGYVSASSNGHVFGDKTFNCKAIEGYAEAAKKAKCLWGKKGPWYMCHDFKRATEIDFAARDFLPVPQNYIEAPGPGGDIDDVDWDSIMIYSSTTFAEPSSERVLTKPGKGYIKLNAVPSALDIKGIDRIYSPGDKDDVPLLSSPASRENNKFREIFDKVRGKAECLTM